MKVASIGTDIGVDSSSAHTRTTVKQQERLRAGAKEAKRSEIICKRNTNTRRVAIASVNPTQKYGFTAVGMSPHQYQQGQDQHCKGHWSYGGWHMCNPGTPLGFQSWATQNAGGGPQSTFPS